MFTVPGRPVEVAVVYQYAAVGADWERLRLRVRRNPMPVLTDDERFAAMSMTLRRLSAELGLKTCIAKTAGFTCYAHAMRPESKGSIHITSADAKTPPAIRFNFLSAPVDAELTLKAVRIARSVMTAPAMAPFKLTEQAPGPARQSDEDLIAWVKATAETTYHPVGTCKMGIDPMAVVDPRLRVHGLHGLRVADASIMPTLTSGNTNAPSIMIGERASDLVLAGDQ